MKLKLNLFVNSSGPSSEERRWGSEDQFVTTDYFSGLTKREYFAAMALASGCTAKDCVLKADAVINELNK